MMELKLINEKGQSAATYSAPDALFARDFNESLVHQVVVAYQANARRGTRAQKGRSDINKSTRKPWQQKGTGRARAGMASSPLWRGGGKIFPNLPDENFSQKLNKKMYRAGMRSIFSQLAREGRLTVIEELKVDAPKTKVLHQRLKGMGFDSVLVIADEIGENLLRSARNLPKVLVVEAADADPVSLLYYDNVLVTRGAVKKIEELLA